MARYQIFLTIHDDNKTEMVYTGGNFKKRWMQRGQQLISWFDAQTFEKLSEAADHYFNINKKFLEENWFNGTVTIQLVCLITDASGDVPPQTINKKTIKLT